MKKLALVAILALTLTGCSAQTEVSSDPTPEPSVSETQTPEVNNEFVASQEAFELITDKLMASCDKGLAEGMSEVGNGVRFVLLPEEAGYESYTAYYEVLEDGTKELVFSLDFSTACYLPMLASLYAESAEGAEIDWTNFPLSVQQISDTQFVVRDVSFGTETPFDSIYTFENDLLKTQSSETATVTVTYGDWNETDQANIKALVDALSE